MNTSMKPIAAGIASLGRNQDSMLVHMTPGEVAGLQTLAMKHGGSLTINPHTGLPEAGFLSSILPTLAGAGLMMVPGMQPWAAGLLVGGLGALTSGSLQKGIMAGLGAYGGAGLGSAFAGMGEIAGQEAANLVGQQAGAKAVGAGSLASVPEALQYAPDMMDPAGMANIYDPSKIAQYTQASQAAAQQAAQQAAALSPWEKMGEGAKYFGDKLTTDPWGAIKGLPSTPLMGEYGKEKPQTLGWAAPIAAVAPVGMEYLKQKQEADAARYNQAFAARQQASGQPVGFERYGFNPGTYNPQTGLFENRELAYQGRYPTFYAAQGGQIPPLDGKYPQSDFMRSTYATSPQTPMGAEVVGGYAPKIDPFTGQMKMAQGGIASLHEYAAGGRLLDGPGDGMSDSIPAVIKGNKPQRAALSDSEFVIPADVVSHLGNGSTKAGAKKLYNMMDKVRMARTGTKQQGKQINPDKFIPA